MNVYTKIIESKTRSEWEKDEIAKTTTPWKGMSVILILKEKFKEKEEFKEKDL